MTVHGVIMVVGGLAFGLAIVQAKQLPRWTGICLMIGVVLVATASGLPTLARTVAEAVVAAALLSAWVGRDCPDWPTPLGSSMDPPME
jgi:hypothetical protein